MDMGHFFVCNKLNDFVIKLYANTVSAQRHVAVENFWNCCNFDAGKALYFLNN